LTVLDRINVCTYPLARAKDHHAGLSSVWCSLDEHERTVAHIDIIDIDRKPGRDAASSFKQK
jgi:hypothetical protein